MNGPLRVVAVSQVLCGLAPASSGAVIDAEHDIALPGHVFVPKLTLYAAASFPAVDDDLRTRVAVAVCDDRVLPLGIESGWLDHRCIEHDTVGCLDLDELQGGDGVLFQAREFIPFQNPQQLAGTTPQRCHWWLPGVRVLFDEIRPVGGELPLVPAGFPGYSFHLSTGER